MTMKLSTLIRSTLAAVSGLALGVTFVGLQPAAPAAAQSPSAAVDQTIRTAHSEAFTALRTGSTSGLRTYHPAAAAQVRDQLVVYRDYGAVVQSVSNPNIANIRVSGSTATASSATTMNVAYFGLFTQSNVARINWHLQYSGGRWLVDGLAVDIQ